MTTIEKAREANRIKAQIIESLILKGYTKEEIGQILADYPKLIANLECTKPLPKWFRDSIVCWYNPSKQGLKNEQIEKGKPFLLKDFSGNGLDMTMHNFAGSGMSGMDGYGIDLRNISFFGSVFENMQRDEFGLIFKANVKSKVPYGYLATSKASSYKDMGKFKLKINFTGATEISNLDFYAENSSSDRKLIKKFSNIKNGDVLEIPKIEPSILEGKGYVVILGSSQYDTLELNVLPLYEGALVFDGVDDYGVSENNKLILNDYTIICDRKILKKEGVLFSKMSNLSFNNGAFLFERSFANKTQMWSFGGVNDFDSLKEDGISYATKNNYNGIKYTNVGNFKDSDKFIISSFDGRSTSGCTSVALKQVILFNRTLTQDELDWVKYNIMGEELPKPIAQWDAKGRRNDEPEAIRNILLDRSGNGHNITLHNFAFSKGSGYGGYNLNYKDLNITIGTTTDATITIAKPITSEWIYVGAANVKNYPKSKVRIVGQNIKLEYKYYPKEATQISDIKSILINKEGIYELPESFIKSFAENYYVGIFCEKIEKNCTIEQIPLYPDALVFDGTDDYGICDNMPIFTKEKGYTLIIDETEVSPDTDYSSLFKKGKDTITMDGYDAAGKVYYSRNFGAYNVIENKQRINFQTSKMFNGKPIKIGVKEDTSSNIQVGILKNIALYSMTIFDHDLTPSAIEAYIRRYIDPKYQLPE